MEPIYFLPIIPVSLIFAGIYYTFFAKQDQAREFVTQLFKDTENNVHLDKIKQQHFILKKRRKAENKIFQKLDMDLERANLILNPHEFVLISIASGFISFIILFVLNIGMVFVILGGIAGLFLPKLYLMVRIMLRMAKARAQFADVLDMMVGCFKSGYGFSRAIQVVAENFEDPWSTELNKVATEMNFGSNQEDALLALNKRICNPDVSLFTTAVLIQRETGGNLAELLSNLSHTIRERYKLLSKVNALSAQGKLSAIIVFCIPFGLAGTFSLLVPEMMNEFVHNPIGIFLIIFACLMQGIGGLVLKKIVSLEV